jgi:ribosomal protein S13
MKNNNEFNANLHHNESNDNKVAIMKYDSNVELEPVLEHDTVPPLTIDVDEKLKASVEESGILGTVKVIENTNKIVDGLQIYKLSRELKKDIRIEYIKLDESDTQGIIKYINACSTRRKMNQSQELASLKLQVLQLANNNKISETNAYKIITGSNQVSRNYGSISSMYQKSHDLFKLAFDYGVSVHMLNKMSFIESFHPKISSEMTLGVEAKLKRMRDIKSYDDYRHTVKSICKEEYANAIKSIHDQDPELADIMNDFTNNKLKNHRGVKTLQDLLTSKGYNPDDMPNKITKQKAVTEPTDKIESESPIGDKLNENSEQEIENNDQKYQNISFKSKSNAEISYKNIQTKGTPRGDGDQNFGSEPNPQKEAEVAIEKNEESGDKSPSDDDVQPDVPETQNENEPDSSPASKMQCHKVAENVTDPKNKINSNNEAQSKEDMKKSFMSITGRPLHEFEERYIDLVSLVLPEDKASKIVLKKLKTEMSNVKSVQKSENQIFNELQRDFKSHFQKNYDEKKYKDLLNRTCEIKDVLLSDSNRFSLADKIEKLKSILNDHEKMILDRIIQQVTSSDELNIFNDSSLVSGIKKFMTNNIHYFIDNENIDVLFKIIKNVAEKNYISSENFLSEVQNILKK